MDRREHVEWAKRRALEYVDAGDLDQALTSLGSDLRKHPETRSHAGIELGMMLAMSGNLSTERETREWIEGIS